MAWEARRPARVFYASQDLFGIARNRSLPAFLNTPEQGRFLDENRRRLDEEPEHPEDIAVRPDCEVLRIESSENGQVIALAAFFALHPTVLEARSPVYSGDLFGAACALVEQAYVRTSAGMTPPLIALFNGAQADVSPRWTTQDREDMLRLARRFADGILKAAVQPGRRVDGPIAVSSRWVDIAGQAFMDPTGVTRNTAEEGRAGAPTLGGAEDGRTPFYALGWHEGLLGESSPTQGPKADPLNPHSSPLIKPLARILDFFVSPPPPPSEFLALYCRMGDLSLVPLPGEFSTVLGDRIRRNALRADPQRTPLLMGLTGAYLHYFVTPEEYETQQYEGSNMLFGTYAGTFIQTEITRLAEEQPEKQKPDSTEQRLYDVGEVKRFGPEDLVTRNDIPYHRLDAALKGLHPAKKLPAVAWRGKRPRWPAFSEKEDLYPYVIIEEQAGGLWLPLKVDSISETSRGLNIVTLLLKVTAGYTLWASVWVPPADLSGHRRPLRFSIVDLDGSPVYSESFFLGENLESTRLLRYRRVR
jgi:hypothetical protein